MKINRVILVHGFNVGDFGAGTTERLRPGLEALGLEVVSYSTGWRGLFMVRLLGKTFARALSGMIREGDLLIGHSDGCNIINKACWMAEDRLPAVSIACSYLNPALDKKTQLSPIVRQCTVFHGQRDWVVWFSKWLPRHPWGQMGRVGYAGQDPRYRNSTYEALGIGKQSHSSVFKAKRRLNAINARHEELIESLMNDSTYYL